MASSRASSRPSNRPILYHKPPAIPTRASRIVPTAAISLTSSADTASTSSHHRRSPVQFHATQTGGLSARQYEQCRRGGLPIPPAGLPPGRQAGLPTGPSCTTSRLPFPLGPAESCLRQLSVSHRRQTRHQPLVIIAGARSSSTQLKQAVYPRDNMSSVGAAGFRFRPLGFRQAVKPAFQPAHPVPQAACHSH